MNLEEDQEIIKLRQRIKELKVEGDQLFSQRPVSREKIDSYYAELAANRALLNDLINLRKDSQIAEGSKTKLQREAHILDSILERIRRM
jgi:hypothetical protein